MKKILAVLLIIIIGLLAYIAFKPQTPAVYPDQIVPSEQTTTVQNESAVSPSTQSTTPTSSTVVSNRSSQETEKSIGDYEVRLSEPLLNTKLYVGDTVQFKVSVGKKVIGLNILGVSLDSDSSKHSSISKIDSSHYSVVYHVLPGLVFLGQNYINVIGITDPSDYSLPIPTSNELEQLGLKIPITLNSRVPVTSIDSIDSVLTAKIGGTYMNGKYIPTTPALVINFNDGTHGVSGDNSVINYTIADPTIAQVKVINYADSPDLKHPLRIVDIVGLKPGTTTLTVTFQNVSKVFTVNVTQ